MSGSGDELDLDATQIIFSGERVAISHSDGSTETLTTEEWEARKSKAAGDEILGLKEIVKNISWEREDSVLGELSNWLKDLFKLGEPPIVLGFEEFLIQLIGQLSQAGEEKEEKEESTLNRELKDKFVFDALRWLALFESHNAQEKDIIAQCRLIQGEVGEQKSQTAQTSKQKVHNISYPQALRKVCVYLNNQSKEFLEQKRFVASAVALLLVVEAKAKLFDATPQKKSRVSVAALASLVVDKAQQVSLLEKKPLISSLGTLSAIVEKLMRLAVSSPKFDENIAELKKMLNECPKKLKEVANPPPGSVNPGNNALVSSHEAVRQELLDIFNSTGAASDSEEVDGGPSLSSADNSKGVDDSSLSLAEDSKRSTLGFPNSFGSESSAVSDQSSLLVGEGFARIWICYEKLDLLDSPSDEEILSLKFGLRALLTRFIEGFKLSKSEKFVNGVLSRKLVPTLDDISKNLKTAGVVKPIPKFLEKVINDTKIQESDLQLVTQIENEVQKVTRATVGIHEDMLRELSGEGNVSAASSSQFGDDSAVQIPGMGGDSKAQETGVYSKPEQGSKQQQPIFFIASPKFWGITATPVLLIGVGLLIDFIANQFVFSSWIQALATQALPMLGIGLGALFLGSVIATFALKNDTGLTFSCSSSGDSA